MPPLWLPGLYLSLLTLCLLKLLHDAINSCKPLLPDVFLVLPSEVKKVHSQQLPAGLAFTSQGTQSGCGGCFGHARVGFGQTHTLLLQTKASLAQTLVLACNTQLTSQPTAHSLYNITAWC